MAGLLRSLTDGLTITEYSDWQIFVKRLEDATRSGRARRVSATRRVFVQGEEWYADTETGEIYVYVSPDAPILPIWEKIDSFATSTPSKQHPKNLSVIPKGRMNGVEAGSLKTILALLVGQGIAEPVSFDDLIYAPSANETWFRDRKTGIVYRLVENGAEDNKWERVPQHELRPKMQ